MKTIGIISGSVRDGRLGEGVGTWVADAAESRGGARYELIDLKSFDVPLLTTNLHPMAANKQYESDAVNAWSKAIDAVDGYIIITPEYNHGVPGALKNAVDSLGTEWVGKPVAFVGYGSVGGVRAIEQWRQVVANFSMVDVRAEVNLSLFTDFTDGTFTPAAHHDKSLSDVFDQIEAAVNR